MDQVVRAAHEAMLARDWEGLRLMLHPYLHWTTASGAVIRGRTRVIVRLQDAPTPEEPIAVELRDGQIYRWREPSTRLQA